jgi:flagellar biogenesis protein FliO
VPPLLVAPTLTALLGPIAVIALFWLAALFAVKKCRFGINQRPESTREKIKIIATKPIGWQTSLLIVESEGHRFLLSAGRNGLTPIGSLDHPPGDRPSTPLPTSLTVPIPESVL